LSKRQNQLHIYKEHIALDALRAPERSIASIAPGAYGRHRPTQVRRRKARLTADVGKLVKYKNILRKDRRALYKADEGTEL